MLRLQAIAAVPGVAVEHVVDGPERHGKRLRVAGPALLAK
jgi:hypothetical protein